VETILGSGGMGVVFLAKHMRLNRMVALKMALAGAYAGQHERERFQREAEAVAVLRHPNVVQIYDVGESAGRPYFTMEFVEGGSLAEKLQGTPLPAREAAAILATLAGAIHVAHEGGIVHRDLKPANILLTSDGNPKITDFGLARRLGGEAGLTRTGLALGTPSYMAPEQARGRTDVLGSAVDIYALGAILYELLTGCPPFRAETPAETVHLLLTQDPVPPSSFNRKVPRDLETVCLKCLHKEPQLRYPTAAGLADDLDRFLRGEAITARPEGTLARLTRRIRRRNALSAAFALSLLLMVMLACGGAWTFSNREAAKRAAEIGEAETDRAVDESLNEMVFYLQKSSWIQAKTALERAKGRLGNRNSPKFQGILNQGILDLELAGKLNEILENGNERIGENERLSPVRADALFEETFHSAGFLHFDDDPE
jgi:eukaryotic-like serine/threonine-protein kinase